jgi:hypothetical protein
VTAFINQVNALIRSGRLSSTKASPLITAAQTVLANIGNT